MTLTDFFQNNQRQENDKTLLNAPVYEMNNSNGSAAMELVSALSGHSSLTFPSSSLPTRDRFTDLAIRIDNIESRVTGIEADAITDIMARLADINERLGALEARR